MSGLRSSTSARKETGNLLLEVKGAFKSFPVGKHKLEILRGIDLSVASGDMCFILGRSGAGKSTLLNLLASLDKPTAGQIFFKDRDMTRMSAREVARHRMKNVGFIFQFYHLLPELSAVENVMLPGMMLKTRRPRARAMSLLERMSLADRANHLPHQLSGGEQQRVAIARALMNEPEIVFCDEPTGNLDDQTAHQVFELLKSLNSYEKQTFCIVTHDDEYLARDNSQIYYLQEGKLVQQAQDH